MDNLKTDTLIFLASIVVRRRTVSSEKNTSIANLSAIIQATS